MSLRASQVVVRIPDQWGVDAPEPRVLAPTGPQVRESSSGSFWVGHAKGPRVARPSVVCITDQPGQFRSCGGIGTGRAAAEAVHRLLSASVMRSEWLL